MLPNLCQKNYEFEEIENSRSTMFQVLKYKDICEIIIFFKSEEIGDTKIFDYITEFLEGFCVAKLKSIKITIVIPNGNIRKVLEKKVTYSIIKGWIVFRKLFFVSKIQIQYMITLIWNHFHGVCRRVIH